MIEITKTDTICINEHACENAAQELFNTYGFDLCGRSVLEFVLDEVLGIDDTDASIIQNWIDNMTQEQVNWIFEQVKTAYIKYVTNYCEKQWDTIFQEKF